MDPVPRTSPTPLAYPRVISAGRLVALKRFEVLLEAMSILAKEIPRIRLDIYGEGPSRSALERMIQEQSLGSVVRILPPLSSEDLFQEIRNASVFALPSEHETFSNLIVEAMAVGTPVVTTHVGGTPEIITDGVNGVLVPSGDPIAFARALARVLNDPAYASQLAGQATTTLKGFSTASGVDGIINVLRGAVH
jgi:glycosyltransferase involved in cell wall biosynthesis